MACSGNEEQTPQPQTSVSPGTTTGVTTQTGDNLPETVSLATHIRPLFATYRCTNAGCHGGSSQAGGVNLTDYNRFKAFATNGTLYRVMANGSMPPGGPRVTSGDLALFQRWVNQGALDN